MFTSPYTAFLPLMQRFGRPSVDSYGAIQEPEVPDFAGGYQPSLSPGRENIPENIPSPPSGLLERIADRMSGMGYGGGEEERRAALRRALMVGGANLLGNSMKKGLGGLPEAMAAGMGGYGEGLQEQAALRRQREQDDLQRSQVERQERYADAQIEQMEEGRKAKQEEFQEAIRARAELVKQRRDALERLPPEQRSRLEPLLGSEEFDKAYLGVTAPPDPEKRVPGFELSPGQDRYELVDGKWTKVASKAPLPKEGGSEKPPWASGQFDYVTRGDQMVKIDKATGTVTPVYSFTGTGADRENARIAVARDLTRSQIENWSDTTKAPDPRQIFADNYRWTQEIVQDKKGAPAPPGNRPPEQKLKDIEFELGSNLPGPLRQAVLEDLKRGMSPREVQAEIERDYPHLRKKKRR
ncbi:MAG TPA: hypothetical protein VJ725_21435 [Thermoanaerobaculia bacterium]|nr:hypothetical protein [Thermoanaerobaculia bacterium]